MIHTIHLDDKYVDLQEIPRQQFEQPVASNKIVKDEYMTSKEFWKEADKRIIKVCEQYGVLQ